MKVGIITKPNEKGQIVIPKEIRDALDLDRNTALNIILAGKGIYIYPIDEVLTKDEKESSYLKLLEKTKGTWKNEDWDDARKKKSSFELNASKTRKNSW